MRDPKGMGVLDRVFMNTQNGVCEGVHVKTRWTLKSLTDIQEEASSCLEIALFSYWGNGNAVCFDGCYGGFIWNDKREILGRFSFQEKDGQKLVFAPMIKKSIEQDYCLNSVVARLSRL
ncbi:hypothetical protein WAI453_012990 [Rhynchosporium graminicola]|uniref:Uncharacterized protein n=1 Tax=Rhynchosporium graminicola TaxID=2792576 RepID=A0A1E1LAB7_9HELO|nr:uncharacterized protein RCO7_07286 [Rhynchosporium commune]